LKEQRIFNLNQQERRRRNCHALRDENAARGISHTQILRAEDLSGRDEGDGQAMLARTTANSRYDACVALNVHELARGRSALSGAALGSRSRSRVARSFSRRSLRLLMPAATAKASREAPTDVR
jgi:hypothetical protein